VCSGDDCKSADLGGAKFPPLLEDVKYVARKNETFGGATVLVDVWEKTLPVSTRANTL